MNVTVFGGSHPKPGEPAYQEALQLGRLLAQAGHTVLTGGYIGTMEAVSRGAAEAGGHVIGVTCQEIEDFRPTKANPWVEEEWRYPTLRERLMALVDGCQAALALPGGPGTLAEISVTWNHLIIGAISPRPLILIGPDWQASLQNFIQAMHAYVNPKDVGLISFAADIQAAVQQLAALNGRPSTGAKTPAPH